ncbi:MAG: hormogonium polysaccharide biosynthesis glycosyltransferase HpsE [Geitlerinemataceae cyanobacterium]
MRSLFSSEIELDFTVAIPTYNGAKRLPEVLAKLKAQIQTESIRWELLIVDNNSTDNTAKLIQSYQQDWFEPYPLEYSLETQQGASFARLKAVREAKGKWVGFLDDDTLPAENWVAAAYRFGERHPKAGAYGSQVHGDYEVKPPRNFEKIASFFAITERGSQPHRYEPKMKMLPPSAGLVVLKQAWCESVPQKPFLSGRSSLSILNSEDLEMVLYMQNAGWEIWYNPEMEIYHKIPRQRLQREYLLYLMRSTGLARHYIRMLRFKSWQKPLVFPVGFVRDIYKAVCYFLKHRQDFDRDVVAACEMEFLVSSIISPFYLWSQSLKAWWTSR